MDILMNLVIPALSEKYDVLLPASLTVGELTPLLVRAAGELSEQRYHSSGSEVLCGECGILDPRLTLLQQDMKTGSRIWLF